MALLFAAPGRAEAAPLVGMHTHLLWSSVDSAEVDRQLDQVASAHGNVIRVDVGWATLEQNGKGQYSSWYLGKVDAVVSKAQARGIKVLFMFFTTPCWASKAPETLKQNCSGAWWDRDVQNYPPVNPADYADALAFLVRRYGSRVAAWEVWNEPNSQTFLKTTEPAREYAAMLKAAYPAAKQADPSSTVIGGSLMQSDFAFTQALYEQGVKGYFDAWSIHPYSDDRSPLDLGTDEWMKVSFIRGVPAVRDVLIRHGDDKPLWLTEFGWHTSTTRNQANWLNGVSETTQATYLTQAYEQAAKWPYVQAAIWFNLKNTGTDPARYIDNFGLIRKDNTLKPAYSAFRAVADSIAGGTTSPPPTDTDPAPTPPPKPKKGGGSRNDTTTTQPAVSPTSVETTAVPDEPVAAATVAAPAAATPAPAPAPALARMTLRGRRLGSRLDVYGYARRAGLIRVAVHRQVPGTRRYYPRASYTLLVRAYRAGWFRRTLIRAPLSRGYVAVNATTTGAAGRVVLAQRLLTR